MEGRLHPENISSFLLHAIAFRFTRFILLFKSSFAQFLRYFVFQLVRLRDARYLVVLLAATDLGLSDGRRRSIRIFLHEDNLPLNDRTSDGLRAILSSYFMPREGTVSQERCLSGI